MTIKYLTFIKIFISLIKIYKAAITKNGSAASFRGKPQKTRRK